MKQLLHEPQSIKAVRVHSFGGIDGLYFDDVFAPEPAAGEVLVRVHDAGVNPIDWKELEGQVGSLSLPLTLGHDFSGVIEAQGADVSDFFVGQSVFGYSEHGGAFADLMVVPAGSLAAKPSSISDIEAAATPLCALTAWQALFEAADLQNGQRILIHGGAGGVGMFAVQFALRHGAQVIATGSGRGLSFLRGLGARQIIDHHAVRFEDAVKTVDVVLDLVGGETLERSWKVLKAGGRLVSTVTTPSQQRAMLCGVRAAKIQTRPCADELAMIGSLLETGEIHVKVDKTFPLFRAPEALEMSRRGHNLGKLVLTINEQDACHADGQHAVA